MIRVMKFDQWGVMEFEPEISKFPAGELNVSMSRDFISSLASTKHISIIFHFESNEDLITLMMVKDIIDRYNMSGVDVNIYIPYFPYGRQDRVCNEGEAFSLKVIANLINSMNFDNIRVMDTHSLVTNSLINNLEVLNQHYIVDMIFRKSYWYDVSIVSPDLGAYKKCQKLQELIFKKYDIDIPLVICTKERDLKTGRIVDQKILNDITTEKCLIVDDIGDGMGTFIPLAKKLRDKGVKYVDLYVTHGIFSKGIESFIQYFDSVYTTNSYNQDLIQQDGMYNGKMNVSEV